MTQNLGTGSGSKPAAARVPATRDVAQEHAWLGTETLQTRLGDFEFVGGYPSPDTAARLREALTFNRAVEAYLAHMPAVSWFSVWRGVAQAGPGAPNQLVLWEQLMDADTLLLTGNTETVYGLAALDLGRDGPVVIEVPPSMLGGIVDLWQHPIADLGPLGVDKGKGGRFLLVPPDHADRIPDGYTVLRSPSYRLTFGVRGFQVDGEPDKAAELIRTARIYPLAEADARAAIGVFNASHQAVDTLFNDDARYFDDLAEIVATEPEDRFSDAERFRLAALGIQKGKPFKPDARRRDLFDEAAGFASAAARANSFDSADAQARPYPDRQWERLFIGGSARFDSKGFVDIDQRAAFAYVAIGMSPQMVEKHVGAGSQYLATYRDAEGAHLDGAKAYRLHVPADVPAMAFWSVVAYDADSRSILRNGQPFPTVSSYTGPKANADGSIDIWFGPQPPSGGANWIQTVPGKGWFALFRFYGPTEAFFDGSWKPGDVEKVGTVH
ncbi:DUF1254 domain-containing protein [Caulobacter sp. 17J65-9]|uniref:DUF1254 domain-containing protein n=1 Tax=Caulobacter sp. 17J65-9 TaxID=2709382 RepID=UPI0013C6C6C5|nr:DUF1254 domain-containing protein [Caulobacter sp. 17J65-9]NEX94701.1 DUF1254 domain-containing protein [Caulobacter sp. 17J65-9]